MIPSNNVCSTRKAHYAPSHETFCIVSSQIQEKLEDYICVRGSLVPTVNI